MKTICGFRRMAFKNKEGEQVNLLNIHYQDDDVFDDFDGVSTGIINISPDFVNGTVEVGAIMEINAKVSRRGKCYKVVDIVG